MFESAARAARFFLDTPALHCIVFNFESALFCHFGSGCPRTFVFSGALFRVPLQMRNFLRGCLESNKTECN